MTPEELYLANDQLVYFILSRYYPWLATDEDYQQIARIGLWMACLTYDPEKGRAFSTYASRCILKEIQSAIRDSFRKRRKGPDPDVSLSTMVTDYVSLGEALRGDPDVEWIDVDGFLHALTPFEREIVVGLYNGETMKTIGKRLGCTHQWVSLCRNKIRKKFNEYI